MAAFGSHASGGRRRRRLDEGGPDRAQRGRTARRKPATSGADQSSKQSTCTGADQSSKRIARRVYTSLVPHRLGVRVLIDWALLLGSMAAGVVLRYEADVPPGAWTNVLLAFPVVAAVQLLIGLFAGLYLGRWRLGGFEEIGALMRTLVATAVLFSLLNAVLRPLPGTAPAISAIVALIAMAGMRYGWRLLRERRRRPAVERARRLIVFGAGEAGTQVITSLLRDRESPYLPVALIDDDVR